MKNLLITGATGNIGKELLHYLSKKPTDLVIHVGVRTIEKGKILQNQ